MSADEFWEGHCYLAVAYRKKAELERERKNEQLWIQGMYFFDGIQRFFGKKPMPYVGEPYRLTAKNEKQAEGKAANAGKAFMESFAASFNASFKMKHQTDEEAPSDD